MIDEHQGQCIYENGRFELRETDNAIIDLKGDFPPILIASNTVDDGSEPNCADTRGVLHLLNELADNNPNEERHWYLKKMLDKSWKQYHEQKDENEQLKQTIEELRVYDKIDYIESEHINNIYKEFGFDGVIKEVKSRLVYGTVTEMDNLIRISTGGWSDDEALLNVLISPMTRFHYHYVGYLVGGAFYFNKDKSFESFRKIRLIKDLERGDV